MSKARRAQTSNYPFLPGNYSASPRALSTPLAVAVMVTGQLPRLELDSKIENLVEPNVRRGSIVDLFFALYTPAAPVYTMDSDPNRVTGIPKHGEHSEARCKHAPYSRDALLAKLHAASPSSVARLAFRDAPRFNVTRLPARSAALLEQTRIRSKSTAFAKITKSEELVQTMIKVAMCAIHGTCTCTWHYRGSAVAAIPLFSGCAALLRLALSFHVPFHRYDSYYRALQLISQEEARRELVYDLVLRLREDSVVVSPLRLGSEHATGPCMVKACGSWGGINDKAILCPRAHAGAAFTAPMRDLLLGEAEWLSRARNSEQALSAAYRKYQLPLRQASPAELPVVVARPPCWCSSVQPPKSAHGRRAQSPKRWCLQGGENECWPPGLNLSSHLFSARPPAAHAAAAVAVDVESAR
jgi:hypothetical protein